MLVANRYLHSTYCDDVRSEVGNKTTLVGIYRAGIDVVQESPNAPVILPKLCVVLTAQTPKDRPFKRLQFVLIKDDQTLQELDVPESAFQDVVNATDETFGLNDTHGFYAFGAVITLQPFAIDASCKLRVRARTEAEELAASALVIRFHPYKDEQSADRTSASALL